MATIRKRGAKYQARIQRKGLAALARTFITRADAEKWARLTESELERGVFIDRSEAESTTLADILGRYGKEVSREHRGHESERIRLSALQRHRIGKLSLAKLKARDIAAYRDERMKTVSRATVSRELDLLRSALNVARRDWGFNLENPVSLVRRPKLNNARSRIFIADEETRLLAALANEGRDRHGRLGSGTRNPWISPMVELALQTAMRRGELLALRWENIDLHARTAHLPLTKNGRPRTVPLSSQAVAILRNLPRTLNGQVFPITAMALRLAFTRAVERARKTYEVECRNAGIAPDSRLLNDLHFHDLRHIATSRLAEKLPNVVELSAVTGHSDLKMLARYYHVSPAALARKIA